MTVVRRGIDGWHGTLRWMQSESVKAATRSVIPCRATPGSMCLIAPSGIPGSCKATAGGAEVHGGGAPNVLRRLRRLHAAGKATSRLRKRPRSTLNGPVLEPYRVTMGVRPDGKPDRRHRTGATEAEVTTSIRQDRTLKRR